MSRIFTMMGCLWSWYQWLDQKLMDPEKSEMEKAWPRQDRVCQKGAHIQDTVECCAVLSRFSRVRHCNFMDCSLPGSSVRGTLQARILEWVAMPFPRGSAPSRRGSLRSAVEFTRKQLETRWSKRPYQPLGWKILSMEFNFIISGTASQW